MFVMVSGLLLISVLSRFLLAANDLVVTLSTPYAYCVYSMFLSRYLLSLFNSSGDTT